MKFTTSEPPTQLPNDLRNFRTSGQLPNFRSTWSPTFEYNEIRVKSCYWCQIQNVVVVDFCCCLHRTQSGTSIKYEIHNFRTSGRFDETSELPDDFGTSRRLEELPVSTSDIRTSGQLPNFRTTFVNFFFKNNFYNKFLIKISMVFLFKWF